MRDYIVISRIFRRMKTLLKSTFKKTTESLALRPVKAQ